MGDLRTKTWREGEQGRNKGKWVNEELGRRGKREKYRRWKWATNSICFFHYLPFNNVQYFPFLFILCSSPTLYVCQTYFTFILPFFSFTSLTSLCPISYICIVLIFLFLLYSLFLLVYYFLLPSLSRSPLRPLYQVLICVTYDLSIDGIKKMINRITSNYFVP